MLMTAYTKRIHDSRFLAQLDRDRYFFPSAALSENGIATKLIHDMAEVRAEEEREKREMEQKEVEMKAVENERKEYEQHQAMRQQFRIRKRTGGPARTAAATDVDAAVTSRTIEEEATLSKISRFPQAKIQPKVANIGGGDIDDVFA